jgi:hypothetical protein
VVTVKTQAFEQKESQMEQLKQHRRQHPQQNFHSCDKPAFGCEKGKMYCVFHIVSMVKGPQWVAEGEHYLRRVIQRHKHDASYAVGVVIPSVVNAHTFLEEEELDGLVENGIPEKPDDKAAVTPLKDSVVHEI